MTHEGPEGMIVGSGLDTLVDATGVSSRFVRRLMRTIWRTRLRTLTHSTRECCSRLDVLDRLPDAPSVLVALGAAHAFKYASLLGRILSELIVDGVTPSAAEIGGFRIDHPILLLEDLPTSFMV